MVRLGGAASAAYINVFRGLQSHFRRHGITLDWVLYADYDALVEAFIKREIDLAWNSPLAYVKIKHRLDDPCQVVAMRDVDVDCWPIISYNSWDSIPPRTWQHAPFSMSVPLVHRRTNRTLCNGYVRENTMLAR
jgi:hypothetical protein